MRITFFRKQYITKQQTSFACFISLPPLGSSFLKCLLCPFLPPCLAGAGDEEGGGLIWESWDQPQGPDSRCHDNNVTKGTFPSSLHPLERTARVEETLVIFGFVDRSVLRPRQEGLRRALLSQTLSLPTVQAPQRASFLGICFPGLGALAQSLFLNQEAEKAYA